MNNHKVLTRTEIIKELSEATGLPAAKVKKLLAKLQLILLGELSNVGEFRFFDLGKIKTAETKERVVKNPKTGESSVVPKKVRPKFVFGRSVRDFISGEGEVLVQKLKNELSD